jgi:hypothetical protein
VPLTAPNAGGREGTCLAQALLDVCFSSSQYPEEPHALTVSKHLSHSTTKTLIKKGMVPLTAPDAGGRVGTC